MKEKGITLIALVITIIVLLILAGVSIAMLTGDNGILTQATRAKDETKIATVEEQRKIAMAEAAMNFENTKYQGITVPAGFAPTRIEGEDTVDDGLVIIDSNGNEFVWIPCESGETYGNAWNYIDTENWSAVGYEGKKCEPSANQLKEAKKSIDLYKGFYVARYEAGVPSNAPFYVSSEESSDGVAYPKAEAKNSDTVVDNGTVINLKPVSKKGNQVWNWISYGKAKTVSENMYSNSSSVSSYLIDTCAWNYICKDIFKEKVGINIGDSSTYGNYINNTITNGLYAVHKRYSDDSGTARWEFATVYNYGHTDIGKRKLEGLDVGLELATGSSEDFKVYNIYDMAGNLGEMTSDISLDNNYFNVRGGSGDGCTVATLQEGWQTSSDGDNNVTFRTVLYLEE